MSVIKKAPFFETCYKMGENDGYYGRPRMIPKSFNRELALAYKAGYMVGSKQVKLESN